MARIRTIKPEFWTDEKVVQLSHEERLFFIGTWNFADDCGHIGKEPLRLKLQIMPADTIDPPAIIDRLLDANLLVDDGFAYRIRGFKRHQNINRPTGCKYQDSSVSGEKSSVNGHGVLSDDSVKAQGGLTEDSLREGKGREGKVNKTSSREPAKKKQRRVSYSPEFEEFWTAYPARRNGTKRVKVGKQAAFREWGRLDDEDRGIALAELPRFAESRDSAFYPDAERYLKHRMFDGLEVEDDEGDEPEIPRLGRGQ